MRLDRRKLMLVDDSDTNNFITKKLLADTTHVGEVICYTSAESALQYITSSIEKEENLPGIILVDIYMEGMDGFDFIDELDTLLDQAGLEPIVMIHSASEMQRDYEKLTKFPLIRDFLPKPLNIYDFNNAIAENL